jgi:homoserine dehydrogenase
MRRYDFAICGFGNVGRALARHFAERRLRLRERFELDLHLTWIIDSSGAAFAPEAIDVEAAIRFKEGGGKLVDVSDGRASASPDDVRATGVEGIVLALPTDIESGQPGLAIARRALGCGLDLVLADKGPALHALAELEELAGRNQLSIGTSAATGNLLPSMTVLRRWFAGARIDEISGILNGTSNYVLTRMRELSVPFEDALAEARKEGIAESDPRLDVMGLDTAVKLAILARGLMNPTISLADLELAGITDLPETMVQAQARLAGRIRLIGRALDDQGRVRLSVTPVLVPPEDPLYHVDGTNKAIRIHSDDLGAMTFQGGASSRTATASALLRDLVRCALERR